jgi:hypothetical protein
MLGLRADMKRDPDERVQSARNGAAWMCRRQEAVIV